MRAIVDLPTLIDPLELDDVRERFPLVEFVPVPWTDQDSCSCCPEHDPYDPPPAEAMLVYRWYGRWVRQPVSACCLEWELAHLVGSGAASELRVDVLLEPGS